MHTDFKIWATRALLKIRSMDQVHWKGKSQILQTRLKRECNYGIVYKAVLWFHSADGQIIASLQYRPLKFWGDEFSRVTNCRAKRLAMIQKYLCNRARFQLSIDILKCALLWTFIHKYIYNNSEYFVWIC